MPSRRPLYILLLVSIFLRIGLILYSEWHDARSVVKYTDIDYRVFSDAARFLLRPTADNIAKGPLGEWLQWGDPYTRETYRYTPLLALLLTPNEWLHRSFGKYVFAICDIINGILIYNLLISVILPGIPSQHAPEKQPSLQSTRASTDTRSTPSRESLKHADSVAWRATLLTALHLLNPMVFAISTRGSSESVLSSAVLITLYYALNERWDAAAVLLGFSVHWKIYPVIYAMGCLGIIGTTRKDVVGSAFATYLRTIVNARTIRFGILSASTFFALGGVCYLVWGYPFLYESYLYHLHRLDHRHNFSPYFYLTYLTHPSFAFNADTHMLAWWQKLLRSPLTSFVPQMSLALGLGLLFGRKQGDLVFTWFVQTVVFVVFNKVCTSQYFLWYLVFLPLLLPKLSIAPLRAFAYVAVWVGTQALWLNEAYKLEFLGENVFYGLWIRSLIYVIGNCWVLGGIMDGYTLES